MEDIATQLVKLGYAKPRKPSGKKAARAIDKKTSARAAAKSKGKPKKSGGATRSVKTASKAKQGKKTHTKKPIRNRAPKAAKQRQNKSAQSAIEWIPKSADENPKPKATREREEKLVLSAISKLHERTAPELQRQWNNLLLRMKKYPDFDDIYAKFRRALGKEWQRRQREAMANPDYFKWPSTKAGIGNGLQPFDHWNQEGMLGYMGYHVGVTRGVSDFYRRKILDMVFDSALPPLNSPEYMRDWGRRGTAARLQRLANEIAMLAKNKKRDTSADNSIAIADWEADLDYLYREYYVGKFNFGWPSIG